jgi:hypothetical protein
MGAFSRDHRCCVARSEIARLQSDERDERVELFGIGNAGLAGTGRTSFASRVTTQLPPSMWPTDADAHCLPVFACASQTGTKQHTPGSPKRPLMFSTEPGHSPDCE